MAKDFSFDVVSEYDIAEVGNALDQAQRELANRYDFKGTSAEIDFIDGKKGVLVTGDSNYQLDAIVDVFESKLVRRSQSLKILDLSQEAVPGGKSIHKTINFRKGLDAEKAKKITKIIRDVFPKSKTQIQGESVRVSSTSKDDLQGVMSLLKTQDFDFAIEFENYR
ncbi:MAG: YajQ family cyclic di-GMP-binding protein [Candidatus Saccharimonadia bacterium]